MKRLVVICILLLFAYLQAGYFIHSLALRKAARFEMKKTLRSNLPDGSLEKFSLQTLAANAQWEEEGKEFWLNNQLYDVVKTTTHNGSTIVYCINDSHEKSIVDAQLALTQSNSGSNKSKINKFHFPDVILQNAVEDFHSPISSIKQPLLHFTLVVRSTEPISPPPQVFFA